MADRTNAILIAFALQLGASVAVPTALLGWGGHALDVQQGTGNLYLLLGLGLAFALSMALVWKIARTAQERLQK